MELGSRNIVSIEGSNMPHLQEPPRIAFPSQLSKTREGIVVRESVIGHIEDAEMAILYPLDTDNVEMRLFLRNTIAKRVADRLQRLGFGYREFLLGLFLELSALLLGFLVVLIHPEWAAFILLEERALLLNALVLI